MTKPLLMRDIFGTVFELTPKSNGSWKEKVLHRFTTERHGDYSPKPCERNYFYWRFCFRPLGLVAQSAEPSSPSSDNPAAGQTHNSPLPSDQRCPREQGKPPGPSDKVSGQTDPQRSARVSASRHKGAHPGHGRVVRHNCEKMESFGTCEHFPAGGTDPNLVCSKSA